MTAALVTGAARGIGAAVTARLVSRGVHVYALDACAGDDPAASGVAYPLASRADLDALAAAHPDAVTPVVADVRDSVALQAIADRIRAEHGGLSVVVAAAAVVAGGAPLWETPADVVDVLWEVDALGVWHTARATLPLLLEQPEDARAAFVAIASTAGETGLFHLAGYCMAKHAVVGLVRGLAADVAGRHVTVSAVCPGSTDTAMLRETARVYGLPDSADLVAHQAIGRALRPDEVAAVVELACTAGPVLHGAILPASGGFAA